MQNKGLGRGLSALFGDENEKSDNGAISIRLTEIEPNSGQPRKRFDENGINELADSIRQLGVITPIIVRLMPSGYYQIIAGERRWRASRLAGLNEIPAVVVEADDRKATEMALVENLQREDLNPIEEAEGYRTLIEDFNLTQEETSERVGKSRSSVSNALRLLNLPDNVRKLVASGKISGGHARTILPVDDNELMTKVVEKIINEDMSVRATEHFVKKITQTRKEIKKEVNNMTVNYLEDIERRLTSSLSRKVRIIHGRKKGKVELEYYGNEDLEKIVDILSAIKS